MRYGERICRIVRSCAQDFSIYSQRRSDNSSLLPWTLNKMDLKELNLLLPFEFGPLSLSIVREISGVQKSTASDITGIQDTKLSE